MKIFPNKPTNLRKRTNELGCPYPNGLAVLPSNFGNADTKESLFHSQIGVDLIEFLRNKDLGFEIDHLFKHENVIPDDDGLQMSLYPALLLPTLCFTLSLLIENPEAISMVLPYVQSFCYKIKTFGMKQGVYKEEKSDNLIVKTNIVVDLTPESQHFEFPYEGPKDGLETHGQHVEQVIKSTLHTLKSGDKECN